MTEPKYKIGDKVWINTGVVEQVQIMGIMKHGRHGFLYFTGEWHEAMGWPWYLKPLLRLKDRSCGSIHRDAIFEAALFPTKEALIQSF